MPINTPHSESTQGRDISATARPTRRRRRSYGLLADFMDSTTMVGALVTMIWQHRLWWMLPLLIALLFLGVLMLLQATPIAPIIYPVF
jgi:fatty acid desaturase